MGENQPSDKLENETEQAPEGLFIEIDEDDAFEEVELWARDENGVGLTIGVLDAEPGRYELKKVSDDE